MTIEEYHNKKASAPDVCKPDTDKAMTDRVPVIGEYITIPTLMYTALVRDSELLNVVIRTLTNKRIEYDSQRVETLMIVLDLPIREGGE